MEASDAAIAVGEGSWFHTASSPTTIAATARTVTTDRRCAKVVTA